MLKSLFRAVSKKILKENQNERRNQKARDFPRPGPPWFPDHDRTSYCKKVYSIGDPDESTQTGEKVL